MSSQPIPHETWVAVLDLIRGGTRVANAHRALGLQPYEIDNHARHDPDLRLALRWARHDALGDVGRLPLAQADGYGLCALCGGAA